MSCFCMGAAPAKGTKAPDFTLSTVDKADVSLQELRGKPVLINFWATWCPPCRHEIPFLQKIYEKYSNDGIVLLAITSEGRSRIKDFLEDHKMTFTVLLDEERDVSTMYGIRAIPTTYFIDKDGVIRKVKIGAFSGIEEIEDHLKEIM